MNVLRTAGDHTGREAIDVNAFGAVVVGCRNDFDDFVAGELERGDVVG